MNITLNQIKAFIAVIQKGSIQAGANHLHKTHPSIITALKKLETTLGFALFDRRGYRSIPTERGNLFYQQCRQVLNEVENLEHISNHLKHNIETEISIAIGDITPLTPVLEILHEFTKNHQYTNLNLLFENLEGANERLFNGDASIIIHHIDKADPRYLYHDFCKIKIIPVVAKGFFDNPITVNLRYQDLKKYTQCIIRSTAQKRQVKNHFILENVRHITVGDQYTKKEIILQKMAWGHMPFFLIEDELKSGQLLSIEGKYIKSNFIDIVVAQLQNKDSGTMTQLLWDTLIKI